MGAPAQAVPPLVTVGVMVTVDITGFATLIEALNPGMVAVEPFAGTKPTAGFMAQTNVALATLELKGVAGTAALLQYVTLFTGLATGIGIMEIV
jgi:hypothetical protein